MSSSPRRQQNQLTVFRLDRGLFRNGLLDLRARVLGREHTSVVNFSGDLLQVINSQFGNAAANISELVALVSGRAEDMKPEDRDRRTLARRIVKAVEPLIEDAIRKEAELNGRPYAQQIREMDEALLSRRGSSAERVDLQVLDSVELKHEAGIASPDDGDIDMLDSTDAVNVPAPHEPTRGTLDLAEDTDALKQNGHRSEAGMTSSDTPPVSTNGFRRDQHVNGVTPLGHGQQVEPPTPPMSLEGHSQNLQSQGGIPWYVAQFDPEGLVIFEERWTGPEVLRDMSEELSEMDEDELQTLGPEGGIADDVNGLPPDEEADSLMADVDGKRGATKKANKRGRNSGWGTRSFRTRR